MKIIDLRKSKELEEKLLPAVESIKKGHLVIIPTETVYGLAADCFNTESVNKIFLVKRRPYSDPLIVHICKKEQLSLLCERVSLRVKKLLDIFWPGPLTVILKKSKSVPDIVTGGLDTVAVRMPESKIARKFISMCQVPLAAPSANIFSRVSSVDLPHVIKDFKNAEEIKHIIYTGRLKYCIESTILDCTKYPFKVLRYGALSIEKIISKGFNVIERDRTKVKSAPGMFRKHYAPLKKTFLVRDLEQYIKNLKKDNLKKIAIICRKNTAKKLKKFFNNILILFPYGDKIDEILKNLYFNLRLADDTDAQYILIEPIEVKDSISKAIMDRMTKASSGRWI
ncbi:MAG: L-threonylcarbamoyladenylate synthase [Endomicrobia bacterium]|nr:L-threonylcarbamoyladenylate synthase [Endomicrobiia bacterium]